MLFCFFRVHNWLLSCMPGIILIVNTRELSWAKKSVKSFLITKYGTLYSYFYTTERGKSIFDVTRRVRSIFSLDK